MKTSSCRRIQVPRPGVNGLLAMPRPGGTGRRCGTFDGSLELRSGTRVMGFKRDTLFRQQDAAGYVRQAAWRSAGVPARGLCPIASAVEPEDVARERTAFKKAHHNIMITLSNNIVILLSVTVLLALANLGCHTANGFGKDVSDTGKKIQNGTK